MTPDTTKPVRRIHVGQGEHHVPEAAEEGILLGLMGGALGVAAAYAMLRWQSFTVGNEGVTLSIMPDLPILIRGMLTALTLGLLASLYPAWKAARNPIVASLRSA